MREKEFDAHEERLIDLWLDARNKKGYRGSFERWLLERVVTMEMVLRLEGKIETDGM